MTQTPQPLSLQTLHALAASCPYDFGRPAYNDIVGIGGDLEPATLLAAYLCGAFPWFNQDDPITWWRPKQRCVMFTDSYRPAKSLLRHAKKCNWLISCNHAFDDVIDGCRQPRSYSTDTWIHTDIITSYHNLHQLGVAFSVEVWSETTKAELIGGLYGLKIGKAIFGESMFHRRTDASKMAFWALISLCQRADIDMIDCQLPNDYLLGLGATIIPSDDYMARLRQHTQSQSPPWYKPPTPFVADHHALHF